MSKSPQNVLRRLRVSALAAGTAILIGSASTSMVRASPAASHPSEALSRDDARWLERVTYGLDSASIARFQRLGRARFLDEQLAAHDLPLPPDAAAALAATPGADTSLAATLEHVREERRRLARSASDADTTEARKTMRREGEELVQGAATRELLQAVYSPAQLKEQMVWFWLNHFSVFAGKAQVRWLVADYADHAIRPNALGKFRDLVMATMTHPAMLVYLDNAQNTAGHLNENYARELMELHTLGVDAGYGQADVQELARVLTGVGLDAPGARGKGGGNRRRGGAANAGMPERGPGLGLYAFDLSRHDTGSKTLLGQRLEGRGFAEVQQAVDLLLRQPACARFVSRKIATYFVADDPPAALVERMAATFRRSDGDIAEVLRTMFEAPEFDASLGGKFKDPMHYLVSALRLSLDGRVLPDPKAAVAGLRALGEPLFGHPTPDGFPLVESGWSSSGQLTARFELARTIAGRGARTLAGDDGSALGATLAAQLSDTTRATLATATTARDRQAYLLASPEFNYR